MELVDVSVVERLRRWISRVAFAAAVVLLAVGLTLQWTGTPDRGRVVLQWACSMLVMVPVLNLIAVVLEEARRPNRLFAAAAAAVLALVAYRVWLAL